MTPVVLAPGTVVTYREPSGRSHRLSVLLPIVDQRRVLHGYHLRELVPSKTDDGTVFWRVWDCVPPARVEVTR
jgi:hypothetical protein